MPGRMDPPAFTATPVPRPRRRALLARVRLADGTTPEREMLVRDISERGLSGAARGAPPALDAVVTVCLPDGRELWGIVRWVDRNLFGVEFATV